MDKQNLLELLAKFLGSTVIEEGATFGLRITNRSTLDGVYINRQKLILYLRNMTCHNRRGKIINSSGGYSIVCNTNEVEVDENGKLSAPNLGWKIEKTRET